jgi:GNAT superfamily N-acetyltransferase
LAGPEEAAVVARLLIGFRDHYGRSEPPDDTFYSGVARLIEDPDAEYLLAAAADGDEPAGVCQLRYRHSRWTVSEDCWLEDLYVRDSARGTGLGKALTQASIDRARGRGCRRIELDVNESNPHAIGLYTSLGFALEPKPPGRTLFLGMKLSLP